MSSLIGQTLGKYRLLGLLGRGGTAEVYRAQDEVLARAVAVKVMRADLGDDPGFLARFEREANAVAQLRHPRIVQVYDFAAEGRWPYMVMELIEGPSLHAELKYRRQHAQPLTLADAARLGLHLAEAIDYAHSRGVIHRDLKPSNILFSSDGQVMLTDFGLARRLGDLRRTETGALVGTPAYMSPEQARGDRSDVRCDVYTLGVILYELVADRLPFEAEYVYAMLLQIVHEPPAPPGEFRPDLPPRAEAILLKALQKETGARYASAGELARAFAEAVELPPTDSLQFQPLCPPPPFQLPSPHELAAAVGLATGEWLQTPPLTTPPSISAAPHVLITSQPTPRPFQVPAEVSYFVGRTSLVDELTTELTQPKAVVALCGLGGIGKTTLAQHLAYVLRDHFVDGVLWANATTGEVLATLNAWARAFGYDFSGLPDVDSRAAALRNVLADKQTLVIVDDVWEAGAVRPLLPGGAHNAVLLTTRNLDLAVALDARVVSLPVLTPVESRHMLARIVGEKRVVAEEESAADIARLLMYHPLALEIAARRLVSRPRWQLADLVERLRDEHHRLDELTIGDKAVRVSFTISWEALDKSLRQTFTHLAVFEGRAFTAPALAAVAGLDKRQAADHLGLLAALSWVGEEGTVHYRQHPLLADFARERLSEEAALVVASFTRMADYYLRFTVKRQTAYTELEAEWDNLCAGLRVAHERGLWQRVLDYAEALSEAWFTRGHFTDARQGFAYACDAARALNDQPALAHYLCQWGRACIEQSDYPEAEGYLNESLLISRGGDHPALTGDAMYQLGRLAIERAEYTQARQWLEDCKQIRQGLDDQRGLAEALTRLSRISYYSDDYNVAEALLKQGLLIQDALGDIRGSIRTLNQLADTYYQKDEYQLCEDCCRRAIRLCEEIQDQNELGSLLETLSATLRQQGDLRAARDYAEKSLALLKRVGNRRSLAMGWYSFSKIEAELKNFESALVACSTSVAICRQLGDQWGLVYILLQLGDICVQLQQLPQANEHWHAALEIAQSFQSPAHPQTQTLQLRLQPPLELTQP